MIMKIMKVLLLVGLILSNAFAQKSVKIQNADEILAKVVKDSRE